MWPNVIAGNLVIVPPKAGKADAQVGLGGTQGGSYHALPTLEMVIPWLPTRAYLFGSATLACTYLSPKLPMAHPGLQ
jgi:hypothetical protein